MICMITPLEFFSALVLVLFIFLIRAINKSFDRLSPPPYLEDEISQLEWEKLTTEEKDQLIQKSK